MGLLDRLDAIDKQLGWGWSSPWRRYGAIGYLWGILVVSTATLLFIGIALLTRPELGLVIVGVAVCTLALLWAWRGGRRLIRAFGTRQR